MGVNFAKARDFVYSNGTAFEHSLFAYHFENGSLGQLHRTILAYKNEDNGFGHGFEHDMKAPQSHHLALEYLLTTLVSNEIPIGNVLDGAPQWLENNQAEDGTLINPPEVMNYPHAPWWIDSAGQNDPTSPTGNLHKLGLCPPQVAERTKRWVQKNLTIEKIKSTEWLFMNYRAFDYFMNVPEFPDLEVHQQATREQIVECARQAPENQYAGIFGFCQKPADEFTKYCPLELIERGLTYIMDTQHDDGAWHDEHGLAQWYPATTIGNLVVLRRYGKWKQ